MFDQTESSIARRAVLIVLGLVAVGGALRLATGGAAAGTESPPGSGTLTVDGVAYEFTTSTCVISDGDFVTAGTGFDGQEQFWVSASSAGFDLALGTESEIEEPDDDKLWLVSNEAVQWHRTGDGVSAQASMADSRDVHPVSHQGDLELSCDT